MSLTLRRRLFDFLLPYRPNRVQTKACRIYVLPVLSSMTLPLSRSKNSCGFPVLCGCLAGFGGCVTVGALLSVCGTVLSTSGFASSGALFRLELSFLISKVCTPPISSSKLLTNPSKSSESRTLRKSCDGWGCASSVNSRRLLSAVSCDSSCLFWWTLDCGSAFWASVYDGTGSL